MLYYNLENICSTNFFGPITFIVFAEQLLSYSVLKVQKKKDYVVCATFSQAPIFQQVKTWEDVSHVSNRDGLYSESAVCCGSLPFGFDVCWMRAFGSITVSSVFYSVHVLN